MRLAVRWLGFASLSAPLSLLVIVRLTLFSALINSPFLCDRKCSSTAIGHLIGIRQNHSTATIPGSGFADLRRAGILQSARMLRTADWTVATSARVWDSRRLLERPLRALPRRRTDRHFGRQRLHRLRHAVPCALPPNISFIPFRSRPRRLLATNPLPQRKNALTPS